MKRKIISIDETKCTGCGQCIPDCPEGALQLIEGKARLVSDLFCDGLGACIGTCPEGAISVIEREAEPYDEKTVMGNIAKQGQAVIRAHLEHLAGHGETQLYNEAIEYLMENLIPIPDHTPPKNRVKPEHGGAVCGTDSRAPNPFAGCPGSAARLISRPPGMPRRPSGTSGTSELRQWPIQLSLLNPAAPYFDNADLLISADCVPIAYADFHAEFLRGRILIIFCPKLDSDIESYIEKLAEIFTRHNIRSISILHMEVPCCSGVRFVVDKALAKAGKTIPLEEKTITIEGSIK